MLDERQEKMQQWRMKDTDRSQLADIVGTLARQLLELAAKQQESIERMKKALAELEATLQPKEVKVVPWPQEFIAQDRGFLNKPIETRVFVREPDPYVRSFVETGEAPYSNLK